MSAVATVQAGDAIRLGRFLDYQTNNIGEKLLYEGERHVLLFGPNGSGKGTRILVPNLLQSVGRSMFVIDPKGELAAITAEHRRKLGRVVIINPFGVLTDHSGYGDLRSEGFNPLASLDPAAPSFNVQASLLAEAMVPVGGSDPHWDESARSMVAACMMQATLEARARGQVPTMARVREMICAASDEPKETNDWQGEGLPKLARQMSESGITGLKNKASQFTEWSREVQGIASSAKRHTESFDDPEISDDLAKVGFDFAEMKRKPVTVYVILPPEMMNRHAKWLRLVLTAAISACMRPREAGEPRALFMLDEFAVLGHLSIIETVWAVVRGYGIQIMPVLQDLNQLKGIYGDRWETFIGMAGAVASFAPNDLTTAEWLSRRSGEKTEIVESYSANRKGEMASHVESSGSSYQQTKVPLMPVHKLFGIEEGYMLLFLAGLSSLIPAYAPSYWDIEQCKERERDNPYHKPEPAALRSVPVDVGWR